MLLRAHPFAKGRRQRRLVDVTHTAIKAVRSVDTQARVGVDAAAIVAHAVVRENTCVRAPEGWRSGR